MDVLLLKSLGGSLTAPVATECKQRLRDLINLCCEEQAITMSEPQVLYQDGPIILTFLHCRGVVRLYHIVAVARVVIY